MKNTHPTERPILYQTDMVRAILKRFKTETRRLSGLEKINKNPEKAQLIDFRRDGSGVFFVESSIKTAQKDEKTGKRGDYKQVVCPVGGVGDVLWVRETYAVGRRGKKIFYKADQNSTEQALIKYKPSIHMPRKYCRLKLVIKNIRIERIKRITDAGAKNEGVLISDLNGQPMYYDYLDCVYRLHTSFSPTESFASLWDSMYGDKMPWKKNPWVWVIEFKIIKPKTK